MTDEFDKLLIHSSEKKILNDILCAGTALPETMLYRQNTGTTWQGKALDIPVGEYVRVTPGMRILVDARPISFGLPGAGDALGSTKGRPLQIETKTLTGRQREVQASFERAWRKAGGIYILARSVDEFLTKLKESTLA